MSQIATGFIQSRFGRLIVASVPMLMMTQVMGKQGAAATTASFQSTRHTRRLAARHGFQFPLRPCPGYNSASGMHTSVPWTAGTRQRTHHSPCTPSTVARLLASREHEQDDEDTIFALSTGVAPGQATAVAVIRLSGPAAPSVLLQLLSNKPNVQEKQHLKHQLPPPRQAVLRKLYHPVTGAPLDQALVLYFEAPHSFTGEHVVELHTHGSRAVIQGLLQALHDISAATTTTPVVLRYAEAGEFTSRAFDRGKLNVLQVEALADLLTADTDTQRIQALQQLDRGDATTTKTYENWRQQLIAGLAHAEAVIDFGDDENLVLQETNDNTASLDQQNGVDQEHTAGPRSANLRRTKQQVAQESVWGGLVQKMDALCASMQRQLRDDRRGELVRQGVQIAILGPPNAGKSSLFNVLASREAAIVSPMAGTTRDVLEVALDLRGVKCILQDTAGVRHETMDAIEIEGMKRAWAAAQMADFVIVLVDPTDPLSPGMDILDRIVRESVAHVAPDHESNSSLEKNTPFEDHGNNENYSSDIGARNYDETGVVVPSRVFLVRNKSDLVQEQEKAHSQSELVGEHLSAQLGGVFDISCVTQHGIDTFLEALSSRVLSRIQGDDDLVEGLVKPEGVLITRARHRQHVRAAAEALERFSVLSRQGIAAVDIAAEELRLAASELGRITGAVGVEDVLDKLFSDFCIGK
jgi:tRNA modification GTPase